MCFYVVLSCVGRGFCDGLITHPEESYRVYNCVIKNLNTGEDNAQIWAVKTEERNGRIDRRTQVVYEILKTRHSSKT
jgi:hypothetical protein